MRVPDRERLVVRSPDEELHARLELRVVRERALRDRTRTVADHLAVAVRRRDRDVELVADRLAVHRGLEPGDDVAGAVQVLQRLSAGGGVDDVTVVVLERVVDGDDLSVSRGRGHASAP